MRVTSLPPSLFALNFDRTMVPGGTVSGGSRNKRRALIVKWDLGNQKPMKSAATRRILD